MRLIIILTGLFAALVFTIIANADSPKFSVIEPLDNSMVEGELIAVALKVNDSGFDTVRIARNKDDIKDINVVKGKAYYCDTITLDYGPNEIVVSAIENGKVIESRKLTVFFRSDISKDFSRSPAEFRKNQFHQENREHACKSCHRTDFAERDSKPKRPEDSMCYQCHKKITSYSNVHGPAARWDCLVCHNKNSRPVKYVTQKPDRESCFVCHNDKKAEWAPRKYVHGPTATGKCTICHNPHASNNVSWLRKPAWNLCVGCHEDRATGKHVISSYGGNTHPTKGRPDPLRYGKELSCASCHNPHAANSRSLFANDVISPFSLCQMCHKK